MPVVPITRDSAPSSESGPSETDLLMALAEMHRQGRVQDNDSKDKKK